MMLGTFLGGVAQGVQNEQTIAQKQRALDVTLTTQQAAARDKILKEARQNVDGMQSSSDALVKFVMDNAARLKSKPGGLQAAFSTLTSAQMGYEKRNQLARRAGLPVIDFGPRIQAARQIFQATPANQYQPATEAGFAGQRNTLTGEFSPFPQPSARDQTVQDLIKSGIDPKTAALEADRMITMDVVPQTGAARLVDIPARTVTDIPVQPSGPVQHSEEATPSPQQQTLWSQAGDATGLWNSMKVHYADLAGQISPDLVPKEASDSVKAQANYKLVTNRLVRALQVGNRFSVGQMKQIEGALDIQPSSFTSSAALRDRLQVTDSVLRQLLRQAENDSGNSELTTEQKATALSDANAIRRFVDYLGVPGPAPAGVPQSKWDAMTNAQRQHYHDLGNP
jgi:hypothetical protein